MGNELRQELQLEIKKCSENIKIIDELLVANKEHFFDLYSTVKIAPPGDMGVEKTLSMINGKWKYSILSRLFQKANMRYSEIKHSLEFYGLADNTLSAALKELENDGLIIKTIYPEVPARVEYCTTEKAYELWKIVLLLSKWHNKYTVISLEEKLNDILN